MEHKTIKWKKPLLCWTVMALLMGFTFYILFKDNSMGSLWQVLKHANMGFLFLGLFLMLLFIGCEGAIIRLLAGTWGGKVPWKSAIQYSFAGFYYSSITPSATGGQPMQLYYMVRDGISGGRSSFVLLTITAVYQLTTLFYGVVMALIKFPYVMGLLLPLKLLICFGIAANGLCAVFILLILFCRPLVEKMVFWLIRLLSRLRFMKLEKAEEKAKVMIEEYSQGGAYLRKYPMAAVKTIILTFCQLTLLYLASYCACLALGLGGVGLMNFIMLQSIVSLAVSAVPLPGAVGASESGFLVMFHGFFTSAQLLPVMVLSRGISFYGFLVISGVAVITLHIRKGKKKENAKEGREGGRSQEERKQLRKREGKSEKQKSPALERG